jgi:hypothetical protein
MPPHTPKILVGKTQMIGGMGMNHTTGQLMPQKTGDLTSPLFSIFMKAELIDIT